MVAKPMVPSPFIVLIVAGFLCFTISTVSSSGPFDYFQFVVQWPPATCFKKPCGHWLHRLPYGFTIHGFWPSNFSGVVGNACNGWPYFNMALPYPSRFSRLVSELRRSWPDVEHAQENTFWGKEWDKHGTCSDKIYEQIPYFWRANKIWKQYNIYTILQKAGILPTASRKLQGSNEIVRAIRGVTGVIPLLRCKYVQIPSTNPKRKILIVPLLHEVVLCYDRTGRNLIHCNYRYGTCQNEVVYLL